MVLALVAPRELRVGAAIAHAELGHLIPLEGMTRPGNLILVAGPWGHSDQKGGSSDCDWAATGSGVGVALAAESKKLSEAADGAGFVYFA